MKNGDTYVRRDDPETQYRVSGVEDGLVVYSPEGGGFQSRVDEATFRSRFRAATSDDHARHRTYRKEAVVGDWAEDPAPIPAWLNSQAWNGFAMPAFEKEDAIAAIAGGRILDTHYHAASDAFIFLDLCGEPIPSFDPEDLFPRIVEAAASGHCEIDVGGETLQATVFPGRDLTTQDGAVVRVYDIGAGSWTWGWAEEPAPAAAPSP
jgi:hypothetical protein